MSERLDEGCVASDFPDGQITQPAHLRERVLLSPDFGNAKKAANTALHAETQNPIE
jgi:hypothetical protein